MKCLLLAGGRGDRLWPLSRQNYPKQFINVSNNHSIFQETVARNMAFCDEFIIVTNKEYQNVVENQMKVFQGITYRCVYEEVGRKTGAAILLSALQLPLSELLFVVTADHFIGAEGYKENIVRAKELANQGALVTFGVDINKPDTRFGYIRYKNEDVVAFCEKPDAETANAYVESGEYYYNSGMFMFRVGDFINEVKRVSPYMFSRCEASLYMKKTEGNKTYYSAEILNGIPAQSIEKTVFEATNLAKVVHADFSWKDIDSLEDISIQDLGVKNQNAIVYECENTKIINTCEKQMVVANNVQDLVIVNTKDAVYIGKEGASDSLKEIIATNQDKNAYFQKSNLFYRKWGSYEIIQDSPGKHFQVREVTVQPGKTIYLHMHESRNENWSFVCGKAKVLLNEEEHIFSVNDSVYIPAGMSHQISNIGSEQLIFIETATGTMEEKEDLVALESQDVTETQLGYATDAMVKLKPTFKDYLWGGIRLREEYNKECDYDSIAESWELSAHPAGQSIVDSGRYKGMLFGAYLQKIGKECLGWKFQTLKEFPLMIKLIDAKEDLSIQVHPGDEYALLHENEYGKDEMWLVLDCQPDSYVYCGFKRNVTRNEVKEHIENATITEILNKVPLHKGQTLYIPAGVIHAIGKGVLLCEVQQNSNSTYRVYDYDRTDKYGNKRSLDIEKALDVMNYQQFMPKDMVPEETEDKENVIAKSKYFLSSIYQVEDRTDIILTEESFLALVVLEGSCTATCKESQLFLQKGDCVFVPKQEGSLILEGQCEVIKVRI